MPIPIWLGEMPRSTQAVPLIKPCLCNSDFVLKRLCSRAGLSTAGKHSNWTKCFGQHLIFFPQDAHASSGPYCPCPWPYLRDHLFSPFLWEHLRVRRSICKPVYKLVLTAQVLRCSCSHSKGGLSCCLSVYLSRQFVYVSSWCPALLPQALLASHFLT